MRFRIFGKPRWPWKAVTVTPASRPPLVRLNRYPGQVIGIALRLPPEDEFGRIRFKQLSILWARPDVRQYPRDWEQRSLQDFYERTHRDEYARTSSVVPTGSDS